MVAKKFSVSAQIDYIQEKKWVKSLSLGIFKGMLNFYPIRAILSDTDKDTKNLK